MEIILEFEHSNARQKRQKLFDRLMINHAQQQVNSKPSSNLDRSWRRSVWSLLSEKLHTCTYTCPSGTYDDASGIPVRVLTSPAGGMHGFR